jgi:hypothetical protein
MPLIMSTVFWDVTLRSLLGSINVRDKGGMEDETVVADSY